MMKALSDFGFAEVGIDRNDFLIANHIIQLGYPPQRIDLITTLKGVEFQICFDERAEVQVDKTTVNFISREHLKQNKLATGRPQDIADVDHLDT